MLRFYGFFEETVPEGFTAPGLVGSGANERYRVRKCVAHSLPCLHPLTPAARQA